MRFEGWKVTGWVALLLGVVLALFWSVVGLSEEMARSYLRFTARTSVALFTLAFAAASLHARWPRPWSTWLLRNRRYLGVGFAVSHSYHLLAILALATWWPHPFLDRVGPLTLWAGGLAYLYISAMTATSFDRTRQWLGARPWSLLHTSGSYYLWLIFAQDYLFLSLRQPAYALVLAWLVLVIALRLWHRGSRHRPTR